MTSDLACLANPQFAKLTLKFDLSRSQITFIDDKQDSTINRR